MTKSKPNSRKTKKGAAGETLQSTPVKSKSRAVAKLGDRPKKDVAESIAENEMLITAENAVSGRALKRTKKSSNIQEDAVEEASSNKRAKNANSKQQEEVTQNQSDSSTTTKNSSPAKKPNAVTKTVKARNKKTAKAAAAAEIVAATNDMPVEEEPPSIPNTKTSNKKKTISAGNRKRKLNNEVAVEEVKQDNDDEEPSNEAVNEAELVKNGTVEEPAKEPAKKKGRITRKNKIQIELKLENETKSENITEKLNTSASASSSASDTQVKSEIKENDATVTTKGKSTRVAKGTSKKTPEVQQNTNTITTSNEKETEDTDQEALTLPKISGRQKRNEVQKPKPTTTSKGKRTAVSKKISDEETPNDVVVKTEIEKKTKEDVGQGRKRGAQIKKSDPPKKVMANGSKDVNDIDDAKPGKLGKKGANNKTPLNPTATIYNNEDFELASSNSNKSNPFSLKISTWNVAGVRSWIKKGGLTFLDYEKPDIFCMQEVKCVMDDLPTEITRLSGYHPYWLCMPGGYAGVAIYSKIMPIHVEYGIGDKEFDAVGRIITAEYEKFFLINVYVLNSGRKLVNLEERMRWEILFQKYVQKLNERKPLVICGDMNVSHQEIDLANPKSNTRSAGFTKEEREKMTALLSLGYVDTFRHLYPDRKGAYTYWTYMANARARNIGWRLDYFLVSERILNKVVDNCIRSQCLGSDHCPITLFLNI